MKKFLIAAVISCFALSSAVGQEACKAVSADGKPLSGGDGLVGRVEQTNWSCEQTNWS